MALVDAQGHDYKPTESGIYVPEEQALPREVWAKADAKAVERAVRFLDSKDVAVFFMCRTCGKKKPIRRRRYQDGGLVLECECKARILQKGF